VRYSYFRRYGQTNCFVGNDIKYGVFAANDKEAYVCTTRAARNMAFQGIFAKSGSVEQLAEIPGAKIVGTKIKAPFSINEEVYVLPMDNVLATKVGDYVTAYIEMSHHTCRARVLSPPSRPTRPTISQH
jgi:leucyl-tRNA synthetase